MNKISRYFWIFVVIGCFGVAPPVMGLTTMGNASLKITDLIVIKDGKIGVGTPTPQYTLDVRGDFYVSGNMYSTMNYVVGSTVDWSVAPYQQVTCGNGGLSATFVNPAGPCGLLLVIKRTGNGVASFPSVFWQGGNAPSFVHSETAEGTTTNPIYDILGLYFDGVNYYGEVNLDFKP